MERKTNKPGFFEKFSVVQLSHEQLLLVKGGGDTPPPPPTGTNPGQVPSPDPILPIPK